jgi:hypothetical protein
MTVAGLAGGVAHVVDLSEGGACLRGAPAMRPGATGTIDLDGVGFPLPFRVLREAAGLAHVVLTLDAEAAAALRAVLARLGLARAA